MYRVNPRTSGLFTEPPQHSPISSDIPDPTLRHAPRTPSIGRFFVSSVQTFSVTLWSPRSSPPTCYGPLCPFPIPWIPTTFPGHTSPHSCSLYLLPSLEGSALKGGYCHDRDIPPQPSNTYLCPLAVQTPPEHSLTKPEPIPGLPDPSIAFPKR